MWPVVVVAINTGLRKMELTMLEWNDIDFDEKLLFVWNKPEYGYHTKNYEPRSVPINGDCFEALLAQRNMVQGTSENVFPNSFGNPRRNNLYRDLKVCYKRAGINGANVHSLRHTFCTQLARRNVPVQKIMKLAGHKDIATTMIYVNLVNEDLRDSVEMLDFGLGNVYNCGKIAAEGRPRLSVVL
jgi:integrase